MITLPAVLHYSKFSIECMTRTQWQWQECTVSNRKMKNGNVWQGRVMSATTWSGALLCVRACVFMFVCCIQYVDSLDWWTLETGVQSGSVTPSQSRQGVLTHKPCRGTEELKKRGHISMTLGLNTHVNMHSQGKCLNITPLSLLPTSIAPFYTVYVSSLLA